ncbi:MAG: class IV adenylate cyclase [Candidatus Pacebacteria bacterium]|nr:class IV adenylate cyclase [Candidatus Paceibacterota bacterium]
MKEIEILIEVKNTKEEALKLLGQFEFKGAKETLDVYFNNPLRTELRPDESGRLTNCYRFRLKDGKATVAYKVDHFDDSMNWTYSDEYETGIDNFDTALQIQQHLGFEELVRIDNTKYTYLTDVYEIVLEDVKDLGLFLEVEKLEQVSDDKVLEVKEGIRNFIKTLGISLGEEQNAGKPELMLRKINLYN